MILTPWRSLPSNQVDVPEIFFPYWMADAACDEDRRKARTVARMNTEN